MMGFGFTQVISDRSGSTANLCAFSASALWYTEIVLNVRYVTNLEERQHDRWSVLVGLRCGQKDFPTGIAHGKRLVLSVPG